MGSDNQRRLAEVFHKHQAAIVRGWIDLQVTMIGRSGRQARAELEDQAHQIVDAFGQALQEGTPDDLQAPAWDEVRHVLSEISRARAQGGFTSTETATFVFALKQPLFEALKMDVGDDAQLLADEIWAATRLLDALGLFTAEVHLRSREDIIARQQQELLELSTPVVQLWQGVLALPLIGTLDSTRTQVVMESLLQRIVDTGSAIAIIDITGVPTVDTLVAQHLLKTVAAARLMGADCIISGIRPQTAQTIVHLGVNLADVVTKATMADAFAVALKRLGIGLARLPGSTA